MYVEKTATDGYFASRWLQHSPGTGKGGLSKEGEKNPIKHL